MLNYIWTDLKMMFRIPLSVFFSMVYPILMMIIMMVSYGNISIGDGYRLIDKYFLISIGMGLLPLALISFPMWIGNSIENNSLERLNFFGVKTSKIIVGDIISHLIMASLSIVINMIFALVLFGLKIPSPVYLIFFLLQYLFVTIVFMIIGSDIALIFKKPQIIMPLGLILMFVLYMFCGVFMPYNELPNFLQKIANYIPMKYAMNNFFQIWSGKSIIDIKFLLISTVYLVIGLIVLALLVVTKKNKGSVGGV